MSNNKSLGSSPFGFKKKKSSMAFIPDRGVAETKTKQKEPAPVSSITKNSNPNNTEQPKEQEKSEKKVVSYYLEMELVSKIKSIADKEDIYYSSLVATALREWIAKRA